MTIQPRDKDEAIRCARYQLRLHFLHYRLYGRIRRAVAFVSLLFGSAALYGVFKDNASAIGLAGIAVAALSTADLVMGWADRAARHDAWRRRMADLIARSHDLTMEDIDRELAQLEGDVDDELESLRVPAFNDMLRSNGLESAVRPERVVEKFVRLFAA